MKAPDMKGRILGFFIPAGSERGSALVYTRLPPPTPARNNPPEVISGVGQASGLPGPSGHNPAIQIHHVPCQCLCANAAYRDWDKGDNIGPTLPAILVIVSTRKGA
jgi:hypothetical protein